MTNKEFLHDKGLFLGQSEFDFSVPVSFETIVRSLRTIKEYQEYICSNTSGSQDNIQGIFQTLGYRVEPHDLRLSTLDDRGAYGHYGNGDVEIKLENSQAIDAVFEIIRQSYEKNR